MRNTNKLVRGIGVKGMDYPVQSNGKEAKEYALWSSMLTRCTEKLWVRRPTYTGTTCSENFKNYSFFYEWCQEQVGFKNKDEYGESWHLDKDLLVKSNKLYSEDTCVFVPQEINTLIVRRNNHRGKHRIGVYLDKDVVSYVSQCSLKGKRVYLGRYRTGEDAFRAYKTYKENLIKQVANEYKSQLDLRVYQALINYTVEITD